MIGRRSVPLKVYCPIADTARAVTVLLKGQGRTCLDVVDFVAFKVPEIPSLPPQRQTFNTVCVNF